MSPQPSPVERARQINRTWTVHGNLAEDTERYLLLLETQRPEVLAEVCERAVASTRRASAEHRDPKPDFYGYLFSRATPEERETFLANHFWTRRRSAELQAQQESITPKPPGSQTQ